ncbi:unnamed protein product [Arctogadus glacialis]
MCGEATPQRAKYDIIAGCKTWSGSTPILCPGTIRSVELNTVAQFFETLERGCIPNKNFISEESFILGLSRNESRNVCKSTTLVSNLVPRHLGGQASVVLNDASARSGLSGTSSRSSGVAELPTSALLTRNADVF